jgi:hypothetical protein
MTRIPRTTWSDEWQKSRKTRLSRLPKALAQVRSDKPVTRGSEVTDEDPFRFRTRLSAFWARDDGETERWEAFWIDGTTSIVLSKVVLIDGGLQIAEELEPFETALRPSAREIHLLPPPTTHRAEAEQVYASSRERRRQEP